MRTFFSASLLLFVGISHHLIGDEKGMSSDLFYTRSVFATKVDTKGKVRVIDESRYEVSVPITYKVSSCSSNYTLSTVKYVDEDLPVRQNLDQNAFEVRAYFKRGRDIQTASFLPIQTSSCAEMVERKQIVTFTVRAEPGTPFVTTSLSVPMHSNNYGAGAHRVEKFKVVFSVEKKDLTVSPL